MSNKENKKNNFIDFEQLPFDQFDQHGDGQSKDIIIKKTDAKISGRIKKISVPVKDGEPRVNLFEKDGIADHIEFICSCGKKVKVKLQYSANNHETAEK